MKQIESFLWGIIAALGALFLQLTTLVTFSLFATKNLELQFTDVVNLPGFIIAFAFIEESLKYIVISKKIESYSLERGFIVNSLFTGLGFAAIELMLLASLGNMPENQILIELATLHIGTSGIIGYLVALKNPQKISTFVISAFFTTLIHAGYNLLVLKRDSIQNYAILAILGFLLAYNLLNLLRIRRKLA